MLPAEESLSCDRNQPSVSRVTQVTTDPVTGQTTYEARQGSKRLELVVGSMALQVAGAGWSWLVLSGRTWSWLVLVGRAWSLWLVLGGVGWC